MLEKPKDLPDLGQAPRNQETNTPQPPINQSPKDLKEQVTIKTEIPNIPRIQHTQTPNTPKQDQLRSQTAADIPIILGPPQTTRKTENIEVKTSEAEEQDFEEAIKKLQFDISTNQEDEEEPQPRSEKTEKTNTKETRANPYYNPKQLGQGYFSEIKHYMKNKNVQEIIDDIIKKDFLTGMKDYHDRKAQGKPYYLHNQDLKDKLEQKMHELMSKEEQWHELDEGMTRAEQKKKHLEQEIDQESQELKDLFRQLKINLILEKEAPQGQEFSLRNGQKLKNLNDLRKALTYMPEEEFNQYANSYRNDFSAWTKGSLQMPEVAHKISSANSKDHLIETLKNIIE